MEIFQHEGQAIAELGLGVRNVKVNDHVCIGHSQLCDIVVCHHCPHNQPPNISDSNKAYKKRYTLEYLKGHLTLKHNCRVTCNHRRHAFPSWFVTTSRVHYKNKTKTKQKYNKNTQKKSQCSNDPNLPYLQDFFQYQPSQTLGLPHETLQQNNCSSSCFLELKVIHILITL